MSNIIWIFHSVGRLSKKLMPYDFPMLSPNNLIYKGTHFLKDEEKNLWIFINKIFFRRDKILKHAKWQVKSTKIQVENAIYLGFDGI